MNQDPSTLHTGMQMRICQRKGILRYSIEKIPKEFIDLIQTGNKLFHKFEGGRIDILPYKTFPNGQTLP